MILRVCLKFTNFLDSSIKKTIVVFFILLSVNCIHPQKANAAGGILLSIKAAIMGWKGLGDNVISSVDELLKGGKSQFEKLNKNIDEILRDKGSNQITKSQDTIDQTVVLEKVGIETHSVEFKNLKNSSKSEFLNSLRKGGKEIIDDDFYELYENLTSSSEDSSFKGFVLINWIGKIYRGSNYFNKPELEEKILLVCKDQNQIFYIALFMEEEPKRAILFKHIMIDDSKGSILPQELFITEDSDKRKIMGTWPIKTQYPENYFIIFSNQNFHYQNIASGETSPSDLKKNLIQKKTYKNKCYKATERGLL